ncbi:hypothetical protein TDB9533_03231 [Thalassocella blandensis]|nr:hypothetical protein TDB9533_03231 [Thalassocella blandensis]
MLALQRLAFSLGAVSNCTADNIHVGQQAKFSTKAYKVQGLVTVINDCSLLVSHFTYNGGGLLDVHLYTGSGGNFASGSALGENLYGIQHENENFVVPINSSQLNNLDAISVWCVGAKVSFGDGQFQSITY